MALCAVMGHVVDGLDVDPRSGGEQSLRRLEQVGIRPRSYGVAATPSGGTHDLVASLGVRSRDGLLPGIDYKAGIPGEGGHGFLFLAPTVKRSKATGELGVYSWVEPPALDSLVLIGGDETGAGLRDYLHVRPVYEGPAYTGRAYADLTDAEKAWADADTAGKVDYWRVLFEEASSWPEGTRDASGRGWEKLAADAAWSFARMAATPWNGIEGDEAVETYSKVLGAVGDDPACAGKLSPGVLSKARTLPVEPPPWDGLTVLRNQTQLEVKNAAVAADFLRAEVGLEGTPLAGMFRRSVDIVFTPRIDEDGYVALTPGPGDDDGPAQVREVTPASLQSRVQFSYRVVRKRAPALIPGEVVRVVMGDPHLLPNLRPLKGVTHTPMLRADGSVLDKVGYDAASSLLFLPDADLRVPSVPESATVWEVAEAWRLIESMIQDFPFNTVNDRANYLALLLTPLLREVVAPPYKMGAINAHQRGSGKSLLAWILRTVHGGVLRGDLSRDAEEFRKQITSVLDTTTAPIVQFDNVQHVKSSQLDALLTSDTWSDRRLGSGKSITLRNDRMWVVTGNNITFGGDLVRRVLWVSIDPQVPNPEARTDFHITNLKGWVRSHRGEILGALLTLVRAWVVAGRPVGASVGEDDFARWIEACRGILAVAGIEGLVGDTEKVAESDTDDELGSLLASLLAVYGEKRWTAADAVLQLAFDDCPEGMKAGSARSLGKWLSGHEGQWAGGLCVRSDGVEHKVKLWRLHRVAEQFR